MANEMSPPSHELIQLLETDRLQTLSVVAGEILRRVKEPLGLIRGRAQTLKNQLEFYQRDNVQGILDEVFHLENLIHSIESVMNQEDHATQSLRPHALIDELVGFFQFRLEQDRIQVMNLLPPDLEIKVAVGGFKQILVAVLLNAIEALETKPTDDRNIFIQYQNVKGQAVFSIEDNGPGVNAEELGQFFLPLHSGKQDHIGLSLALCKKICQTQGWQLKAFSQKNQGTRLELWLPGVRGAAD